MTTIYFDKSNLPSRAHPYAFSGFNCTTFGMKQLEKLSTSIVANDVQYLINAMSDVVDVDVNQLTIGDFYFLLAWQRMFCYQKSKPITANWKCVGTLYDSKITGRISYTSMLALNTAWDTANDEQRESMVDPDTIMVTELVCGNENSEPVTWNDFPRIWLPETKPELDDRLDYPRVQLLSSLIDAMSDPELVLLAPAVQWIKLGSTIEEKVEIIQQENDLSLFDIAAETNIEFTHGISEVFTKVCPVCGTEHELKFKIEPHIFFRL